MSAWRVLRHRSFALVFAARTISMLGSAFTSVALAFAILQVGGSAGDIGVVLAARAVPLVLLLVFGGIWADRLPRQQVMRSANVVSGLSQAALAALLLTGRADIVALTLLCAVGGAAQAFFFPASTGVIPQTVPPIELQAANGLLSASLSVSSICGAALAGVLVEAAGPGWAIALDASSYLVAAGCLARLRLSPRAAAAREGMLVELAAGWRQFVGRSWVWVVVVQFTVVNAAVSGSLQVLGPLVAREHYRGAAGWGVMLSLEAVGTIAGSLFSSRLRVRRPLVLAEAGALLLVLPIALLAVPAPFAAVGVAAAVAGVGSGVFGVLWDSALQRHIPPTVLSRVSAYDLLGSVAAIPVGLALAGPLAEAVGLRATLVSAAVAATIATLAALATPSVRRDDDGLNSA